MQQLQKTMNPQMLAQMGGAKNLMSMMKNIDMNAMKKMMGQFYPVCCNDPNCQSLSLSTTLSFIITTFVP